MNGLRIVHHSGLGDPLSVVHKVRLGLRSDQCSKQSQTYMYVPKLRRAERGHHAGVQRLLPVQGPAVLFGLRPPLERPMLPVLLDDVPLLHDRGRRLRQPTRTAHRIMRTARSEAHAFLATAPLLRPVVVVTRTCTMVVGVVVALVVDRLPALSSAPSAASFFLPASFAAFASAARTTRTNSRR